MRKYDLNTQKGKIIKAFILKRNKWLEDFEIEKLSLGISNSCGSRLSELKKIGVCEVYYYENPNKYKGFLGYKRAKYKLTEEAFLFYKSLYLNEVGFLNRILLY